MIVGVDGNIELTKSVVHSTPSSQFTGAPDSHDPDALQKIPLHKSPLLQSPSERHATQDPKASEQKSEQLGAVPD